MDYTEKMYIPLCNLYNKYYSDLENVIRFNEWQDNIKNRWDGIKIKQLDNLNGVVIDAGNNIEVKCQVDLQNIDPKYISVQVYSGKVLENGILEDIQIKDMEQEEKNSNIYKAKINLTTGGDYGYTFRVMPKHEMVLDAQNLNLIKWITDEMQKEETFQEENKQEELTLWQKSLKFIKDNALILGGILIVGGIGNTTLIIKNRRRREI